MNPVVVALIYSTSSLPVIASNYMLIIFHFTGAFFKLKVPSLSLGSSSCNKNVKKKVTINLIKLEQQNLGNIHRIIQSTAIKFNYCFSATTFGLHTVLLHC